MMMGRRCSESRKRAMSRQSRLVEREEAEGAEEALAVGDAVKPIDLCGLFAWGEALPGTKLAGVGCFRFRERRGFFLRHDARRKRDRRRKREWRRRDSSNRELDL